MTRFLRRVNGRKLIIEINGDNIRLAADPTEKADKVFRHRVGSVGSFEISDEQAQKICRRGQGADSCIFLSIDGEGFKCEKFSSCAETLLEILEDGKTKAKRIGNCALRPQNEVKAV